MDSLVYFLRFTKDLVTGKIFLLNWIRIRSNIFWFEEHGCEWVVSFDVNIEVAEFLENWMFGLDENFTCLYLLVN